MPTISIHPYVNLDPAPRNARDLRPSDTDVEACLLRIVARMDALAGPRQVDNTDRPRPSRAPVERTNRGLRAAQIRKRDVCIAWMKENPTASNHQVAERFGYGKDTVSSFRRLNGLPPFAAVNGKTRFAELMRDHPDMTAFQAAQRLGLTVKTTNVYRSELLGSSRKGPRGSRHG